MKLFRKDSIPAAAPAGNWMSPVTAEGIVYLDGDFVPAANATVSVFDRGFLFGDAVYEVIPVRAGKIVLLRQHLERLHNSLRLVGMDCDLGHTEWQDILQRLLQAHDYPECSMYIQVSGGVDTKRRHAVRAAAPTVLATCFSVESDKVAMLRAGVKVVTAEDIRWQWCHIKTTCLLANVLLRMRAAESGCYETLLLRDGMLSEGAASNIFMVSATGEVHTPPLAANILPGITRQLLLRALTAAGITCVEKDIPASALGQARELWLSSSGGGLVPVVAVDGNKIADGSPGGLWRQAEQLLLEAELAAA